jgi:hypothetical protein
MKRPKAASSQIKVHVLFPTTDTNGENYRTVTEVAE